MARRAKKVTTDPNDEDVLTLHLDLSGEISPKTLGECIVQTERLLKACGAGAVTIRSMTTTDEPRAVDVKFATSPKTAVQVYADLLAEAKALLAEKRHRGDAAVAIIETKPEANQP